MAAHAERLRALQPTLLAAPPAVLVALARLPGAAAIMAPPALVLSVADVLDAAERAEIEAAFGTRVGQLYQATEGFLAATCPQGALHWNEDNILVQKAWLDESRTHYYPVITDFRRTTQPMIRYQMDDIIAEPEHPACPCGSVFGVLGAIAGRKDDVLQLAALEGGKSIAIFPDFVRRAIVLAAPAGVEYRVRQRAPSHWDIFLSDLSAAPAVSAEVGLLCQELRVQEPALHFLPWSPEPLIHKQRRVQCLI
jgi:putative adenylate-forming enzyme